MTEALAGVRILDLTNGPAGGIASMILADFGAEVITVLGPDDRDLAPHLAASRMWRRGKQVITLDANDETDRARLNELAAGADATICTWRTRTLTATGFDWPTLHARHPHLIFSHVTGFGSVGPYADMPGYEHIAAAAAGRMLGFAGVAQRHGPVFSALQVGIHACAQSTATALLAALTERGDDGEGRLVETSMLQGILPYEQGAMIAAQFPEQFSELFGALQNTSHEPPMPSLYYHPAQAGDGRWMQFGNLLPHLFDNFLIVTELMDVLADPDYNQAQMMLATEEKHEAFRERMLRRIQDRTAEEWMTDFIADGGVVATKYQTTQQALEDPDIVANGHVIERESGGVQLGPLARMTDTPAQPGPDAADGADRANTWAASPRPAPTRGGSGAPPLTGIKVVELATIIAAPFGASFLAEMGADVTKVEQIGGDPYRGLGVGIGSARVNAGKRSISVDLKSEAGREAVLKLVDEADILIHNFRPGVPERLGIGYKDVSARNPRLVYLQSNGYGPDGPGAQRPSTHPIPGAAMGGVMYQVGERVPPDLQDIEGLRSWTRRLMKANEVNPDPNTALVVATSCMLGLAARRRTGKGQQIFIDMFGANAYANHDDFLAYPGKPGRPMPDDDLCGLGATYRLYECAEGWVFLALTNAIERERFAAALGELGIDGPSADRLAADDSALADELAALFATRDAADWQAHFVPREVACLQADALAPAQFWLNHEQSDAMGLTVPVEHPTWGPYRRHGPMAFFDGRHDRSLLGPPLAGQHNTEILRDAGYDDAAIAQLAADGVIWTEVEEGTG